MAGLLVACNPSDETMPEPTDRTETPEPVAESVTDPDEIKPPMAEQRPHVVSAPAAIGSIRGTGCVTTNAPMPDMLAYLEAENEYKEARMAHLVDLRERTVRRDCAAVSRRRCHRAVLRPWLLVLHPLREGHEYPIYARRKGELDADEEILLNVNDKAEDHSFYQVGGWDVSMDGQRLAWLEDTVGRRQHRR
jgi:oligopeptidase B